MDAERVAVRRARDGDRVVEVLRVGAVDREDRLAAQVETLFIFLRGDRRIADVLGVLQRLRGEFRRNAVPLDDRIRADARAAARAEHLLHGGARPVAAVVLLERDEHLVAVLRAVQVALLEPQIVADRVVGNHLDALRRHRNGAGRLRLLVLHDAAHAPRGAALLLADVADDDRVADQRPLERAAVDENVLAAVDRARKAEALRKRNERRRHVVLDRDQLDVVLAVHQNQPFVLQAVERVVKRGLVGDARLAQQPPRAPVVYLFRAQRREDLLLDAAHHRVALVFKTVSSLKALLSSVISPVLFCHHFIPSNSKHSVSFYSATERRRVRKISFKFL